ncbi:MAG TPA: hypothetical protein VHW44_28235 [Pseudonocardiaceae bacterium]|jgi:ABC-type uncharacterized transport system permease subunit|nr:hypothetical protein [Pseudonocardiaceae bacterium]
MYLIGAALFGAMRYAALPGTAATLGGHLAAVRTVFIWTVPFMAIALVLSLVMKEKPPSEEMIDVAAGNIEVPEF